MNVNDMEIVRSVLFNNGYIESSDEKTVSLILVLKIARILIYLG